MNTKTHPTLIIVTLLILLAGLYKLSTVRIMTPNTVGTPVETQTPATTTDQTILNTAMYQCDEGKTITAVYMDDAVNMSASTGSVKLLLSDGRTLTLPQTTSADGARYASQDGNTIFWSKGTGFTFVEDGKQTFPGCIQIAKDPGGLPQVYESGIKGFSIRYPSGYIVNDKHIYQALGPGKDIQGVKFTIPSALTTGTNLSTDSYVSVEYISNLPTCSASVFVDSDIVPKKVTDGGVEYSVALSSDAGAGNRYEEVVYALTNSSPCMAVRYFFHYGAIGNYPTGVKEFDRVSLEKVFDAVRRSLVIGR